MGDVNVHTLGNVMQKLIDMGDGTHAPVVSAGATKPFAVRAALGAIDGVQVIHKFGSATLGTTYGPVCDGGVWNTPQVAQATTFRVKAGGHADDSAAGTGARSVTIQFMDTSGVLREETVATAGASASASTATPGVRVTKSWVSGSGTYATSAAGSHAGDITIENSAGGTDWCTIPLNGFPGSTSQIAAFPVPLGKTAIVAAIDFQVATTKPVDILFFAREGVLDTSAPYEAMKVVRGEKGVTGISNNEFEHPLGPFPELTDIGFLAKGATSPELSIDFTIILIDNVV